MWDSTNMLVAAGAVGSVLSATARWTVLGFPLLAAWTVALFLFPFLSPRSRPSLNDALGRPGTTACGAAALALTIGAVNLTTLFLALMAYDPSVGPLSLDNIMTGFVESIVHNVEIDLAAPGYAVTAAWSVQALSGRWRPDPDWLDRAGRLMGLAWVVLAVLHPWILSVFANAW